MAIELISEPEMNEIKALFPNAYLKINDVEVRIKEESEVWIRINIFANSEARHTEGVCSIKKITEKVPFSSLSVTSFDKEGITTAAYEYLKTLEKYEGIDV